MDTQQLLEAVQMIEVLKSLFVEEKNEWLPVIAAIGGAFIGGISTFFPAFILEARKSRKESQSITTALLSEISALLVIIEHRKYLKSLQDVVDYLAEHPSETYSFSVRVPEHYSRIYQTHAERIGLVKPSLASKIIEFHQLLDSVVQDVSLGGLIPEKGGTTETYEELIVILESAISIGKEITGERA